MPAAEDDERPGAACYCGRSGCIETWLSGPALSRDYARRGGNQVSAVEIASRAAHGEARATAVMVRYEQRFARAIASDWRLSLKSRGARGDEAASADMRTAEREGST